MPLYAITVWQDEVNDKGVHKLTVKTMTQLMVWRYHTLINPAQVSDGWEVMTHP